MRAPELRFQYTGSYSDPQRFHIGSGSWMNEAECRACVARMLRNPEIRGDSIRVSVQQKKSPWLHLKRVPVSEIFPDLQREFEREMAIKAILDDSSLPSRVHTDIVCAVKRGVALSLAETRQLVAVLEKIQALESDTK